ncbi:molecular chaperone [Volvox carteri f. nagariensis]|uniref:Molecular chaperone n=1 Tax=Volvox carteri f. nagariensis TaxID=3068 RepID=D8TWW6_VOLCA|nr:molecular chaperone [Volvox carteri f. nagariensis]EFJ48224.1 molecular chaperone [Volvox carteri f. nagariensis]|eukprot:XP_002950909.1 molecular chaperone [Volvox carteri f. nagariensis]
MLMKLDSFTPKALNLRRMHTLKRNLSATRSSVSVRCTASSRSSYFEILGVTESASLEEVKAAFRSKSKYLHPDVNKAPTAARDFMLLRRAYTTLASPELRAEYEAILGLPSARSRDPRFARFERWRREVIPDLVIQVDAWTRTIDGYLAAWRASIEKRERNLVRLYSACASLVRQLQQLRSEEGCTQQYNAPPSAPWQLQPQQQDAWCYPDADFLSVASPADVPSGGDGNASSYDIEKVVEAAEAMLKEITTEIEGIATDSGDGTARLEREVEKRYQQVSMRYPAYPDIVWMDMWEETSGSRGSYIAPVAFRFAAAHFWGSLNMDLSSVDLESSREQAAATKAAEARAEEGADVTLLLSLPEGEKAVHKFKTGVTVAYVKAFVAEQHHVEFAKMKLLLGGRMLIDPLSLSDCPGIVPGQEITVEVSVN